MELQNKTPVHVGLYGHIDSGKTAVASVLSEIISTAGIDAHPQSKERGITIDLGFTSFILEDYLITLVDGPGHADLIKISASSVEIIDCAIVVIDINKGPQVQTGEHIIMIESLNIQKIIVILNKTDLFKGNIEEQVKKTKEFFKSTVYGENVPIHAVSAKKREGFEELKQGILNVIQDLDLTRDKEGEAIMPIDHHFLIKGRGPVITGTLIKGSLKINQALTILPVKTSGRVKSIQIFHQDVKEAHAGDRVGINVKGIDVKKIYRGCIATSDEQLFEFCDILDVNVKRNKLFKAETHFGTQVHLTIGMFSTVGNIFPYEEVEDKKIQSHVAPKIKSFKAFLWLKEKVLISKARSIILISRLDLPPTTLRILGAADIDNILEEAPTLYKYKTKQGKIQYPEHSQGIVCTGLANSFEGAKKMIGKRLEPPFTQIKSTFGTKGALIIGIEKEAKELNKGDTVLLKELRSYKLKPKTKDLF